MIISGGTQFHRRSSSTNAQESVELFCHKITVGKRAQVTDEFMIFARIGALGLTKSIDEAIERAMAYINAGADGVAIHNYEDNPAGRPRFLRAVRAPFRTPSPYRGSVHVQQRLREPARGSRSRVWSSTPTTSFVARTRP